MLGLMMDRPLLISSIIDHAALYHEPPVHPDTRTAGKLYKTVLRKDYQDYVLPTA